MTYLAIEEGWMPLLWYAPGNCEAHEKVKRAMMAIGEELPLTSPATNGDWGAICGETLRALRKGHEAQVTLLSLLQCMLACTKW